jgi:hypothetical protein
MAEVVAAITAAAPDSAGRIAFDEVLLPFPGVVDAASFTALVGTIAETPFPEAVADSVARFRELIARGLVDPARVLR